MTREELQVVMEAMRQHGWEMAKKQQDIDKLYVELHKARTGQKEDKQ